MRKTSLLLWETYGYLLMDIVRINFNATYRAIIAVAVSQTEKIEYHRKSPFKRLFYASFFVELMTGKDILNSHMKIPWVLAISKYNRRVLLVKRDCQIGIIVCQNHQPQEPLSASSRENNWRCIIKRGFKNGRRVFMKWPACQFRDMIRYGHTIMKYIPFLHSTKTFLWLIVAW